MLTKSSSRLVSGCLLSTNLRFKSTAAAAAVAPGRSVTDGPGLGEFLASSSSPEALSGPSTMNIPGMQAVTAESPRTFFLETYGCQMNVSDSEIVHSVLSEGGYRRTFDIDEADAVLVNTCAIRENAESKIWNRLNVLKSMKRSRPELAVGVLGCMAERLKTRLLENDTGVDLIAGPDAYRDLPNLLQVVSGGEQAANVQLSADETYADVTPTRTDAENSSAFVSIMRGCNNYCSFCVVPYTRGLERSRKLDSIVDEVRRLQDDGFRDVVLLGQNVNSYHDRATEGSSDGYTPTPGFSNNYRRRGGAGARFVDLLDQVSDVAPDMRISFTSPHPKDFPNDLLELIAERPNLVNYLHLPAQSGSTAVLERMRRGHTRDTYLELVDRVRGTIPNVSISSDFISGFCGETEADHSDTISLLNYAQYDSAFLFAYSMREKTIAHKKYGDDVPQDVKIRRLSEAIEVFHKNAKKRFEAEIGRRHLVHIVGESRRSTPENPEFVGRTHNNKRCIVTNIPVLPSYTSATTTAPTSTSTPTVMLQPGDFAVVDILSATSATLRGHPVARSSIPEYHSVPDASCS